MADEATTDQQTEDGAEQSEDQAAEVESGVADGAEDSAESEDTDDSDDDSSDEDLLSPEEVEVLSKDPKAYHKALNRAFTTKSQKLSAQMKQLEPYMAFFEALENDSEGAIRELAERVGLRIEGGAKAGSEQAKELGAHLLEVVQAELGDEYGDLSPKMARAMEKVAEMVATRVAQPLAQEQHRLLRETAEAESARALEVFGKTHPDFKKHEKAMVEMSRKVTPQKGVTEQEYLGILYDLVQAKGKEGDLTKKIVKRINQSAKSSKEGPRVPAREVKTNPSALPTFAEAAEAADRGEVWDNS